MDEEDEIDVDQVARSIRLVVPEHAVCFELRDGLIHHVLGAVLCESKPRSGTKLSPRPIPVINSPAIGSGPGNFVLNGYNPQPSSVGASTSLNDEWYT